MTVKICASVTARTTDELVDMILRGERMGADIIEVRMDYLREDMDFKRVRGSTSLPLLATNRLPGEGGLFKGLEKRRVSLLFAAASEGFEYVDLELATPLVRDIAANLKEESGAKLIISHHNFRSTPSPARLNEIFREEMDAGADVCKIITTANAAEDNLTCLSFTAKASKIGDIICFCVNKKGIPSRLFSPLMGGYMTYASLERGREAASGQLTVEETKRFYELLN